MHLADAFIQSDSGYTIFSGYTMCSLGIEPTTFALQTQCSTTEPQEQFVRGFLAIATHYTYIWRRKKCISCNYFD